MARTLIGTRIRERRRAQKLTQTALAKSVGISASYLNLIEHNRRGIAGKTLLAIARELGLPASELTEGADASLLNSLTEAANADPSVGSEVDRIEEFLGRFPGWAKLTHGLVQTTREQKETLTALSDQMAHDPFVSETMHQILSNITAIRSTASILATSEDIPADLHSRFLGNLHKDSQRLSDTAQKMVDFFDKDARSEPTTPAVSRTHDYWAENNYVAADGDRHQDTGPQVAPVLGDSIARYHHLDETLPPEVFAQSAEDHGYDPLALARYWSANISDILVRMAQMPPHVPFPNFGLIEVDMSGAVLMRKPTPELALPLYSSACPLWPIYRAFTRPDQIVKAPLEMPSGDRVLTYSCATHASAPFYDLPPILRSIMIFTADARIVTQDTAAPILAGLHCSVCPRKNCDARRVDYILA